VEKLTLSPQRILDCCGNPVILGPRAFDCGAN